MSRQAKSGGAAPKAVPPLFSQMVIVWALVRSSGVAARAHIPESGFPREVLERVMAAGLLAPSSKNIRPLEFVCVQNPDTLAQLATSPVRICDC